MPVAAKEILFSAVFLLIMVASLASQDLLQDVNQVDAGSIANTNDEQTLHKYDEIANPIDDQDVEALRPIDHLLRRHETDGNLETRVESRSPGIIAIKACIKLFKKALTLAFQNGSKDPKKNFMPNIQLTAQVKVQKAKLIRYHGTLEELIFKFERMAEYPNSERVSGYAQAVMFHNTLRDDSCFFMKFQTIHDSSADFFSDFAIIQVTVNEAIIEIYPEQTEYKKILIKNAKRHIHYAKTVEQIFEYSAAIKQLMDPNIEYWMTLLPDTERDATHKYGAIKNGDMVSFRRSDKHLWLGCAGKKNKCSWATCPGEDNPMANQNGQYICWGEIFVIQAIYPNNGFIKNCDKVGLRHWYSGTWLSGSCKGGRHNYCETVTRTCPGTSATAMANGKCTWEEWTLHTYGKACGQLIYDRDVINFRGGSTTNYKPLNSKSTDSYVTYYGNKVTTVYETFKYTIFRSHANYSDYNKDSQCNTK